MALETSLEKPAPVRAIANAISGWIDRLGAVWVEGQITQISRRPGLATVFLTLRDSVADISVPVTCSRVLFDSLASPPQEGASVVIHARPSYYANRGTLSLQARDIRMVGLGELLARLEQRRQLLAAEGLFAAERKRRLPTLPALVGLVTAPKSAAERDIIDNATRRWPGVRFEVAYAAMQGARSAAEVIEAVRRLDSHPVVDVIVIARGGGSVEDLLPFSDEGLIRVVAAARTPVVSAIGHEPDTPLLDLVADLRASTPTDAAKRIVPDLEQERGGILEARSRIRGALAARLQREQAELDALRSRPSLADPTSLLEARADEVEDWRHRMRRSLERRLDHAADDLDHRRARVRALSPLATLQRGYAVIQDAEGQVLTSVAGLTPGAAVSVRLADGRIHATTTHTEAAALSVGTGSSSEETEDSDGEED